MEINTDSIELFLPHFILFLLFFKQMHTSANTFFYNSISIRWALMFAKWWLCIFPSYTSRATTTLQQSRIIFQRDQVSSHFAEQETRKRRDKKYNCLIKWKWMDGWLRRSRAAVNFLFHSGRLLFRHRTLICVTSSASSSFYFIFPPHKLTSIIPTG